MRAHRVGLLLVLLLLATLVAGCATPDPTPGSPGNASDQVPDGAVDDGQAVNRTALVTVSGTIVEEGPPYNRSGYCGMTLPSLALNLEDEHLYYRPSEHPIDRNTSQLLLVDVSRVEQQDPSGCGPFQALTAPQTPAFNLTWNRTGQMETWPGTVGNRTVTLAGTTLHPGGSVNLTLNQSFQPAHREEGPYWYNGTLTVTLHGWWPLDQVVPCPGLSHEREDGRPTC